MSMTFKDIAGLMLGSHNAKEFRDGLTKSFTMADYRMAVDEEYEPNPFIARWNYVGEQPFTSLGLTDQYYQGGVHTPGEEKMTAMYTLSDSREVPLRYCYYRQLVDRVDLAKLGNGFLQSVIRQGMGVIDNQLLIAVFGANGILDSAQQSTFPDAPNSVTGRAWIVGAASDLASFLQGNSMTTDTLADIVGAERVMGLMNHDTLTSGIFYADPKAFYLAGEREPAVYIDEDTYRLTNQVQIVVERALSVWVDTNRVARWS